MGIEYSKYPICDTNIIIDLNLGDILNKFLENKKKIWVCDKVFLELKSKFKKSQKYSYLTEINSKMKLIDHKYFSENELKVMNIQLLSYEIENCIGTENIGEDFGEFVSSIYAVTLGIKELYTNDKKFIEKYANEPIFKSLIMRDLDYTLRELVKDKERIKIMKLIEEENRRMNKILKEENEKDKIEKMIILLKNKYE